MAGVIARMTRTWFIDLDGTVLRHRNNNEIEVSSHEKEDGEEVLPGVLDFLKTISDQHIILTTARLTRHAKHTEKALARLGVTWDTIIYNLGSGERVLVNDIKPLESEDNLSNRRMKTAFAVNVNRNEGLRHLVNDDGLC